MLDPADLAALSTAPVDRVRAALAAGDEAGARDLADAAARGWRRGVDGFTAWNDQTFAYLTEAHGPGAAAAARAALDDARARRIPWPGAGAPVAATPDTAPLLADLLAAEAEWRDLHDEALDDVCALLSHVYRVQGLAALRESMEYAGERTLLTWMPTDVARSADERVRTWAAMLQGNFATVRVSETEAAFVITQDPCGSCGRMLLAGRHPGPLDHATVTEVDPVTFDRGDVPVYRTHVAVMHFLVPEARLGVPWPVVACPRGLTAAPCTITIFKDHLDPAALRLATTLRGAP
ncbi:MAG: hypothetical protein WCI50_10130 [Actinomycetes bacterium]